MKKKIVSLVTALILLLLLVFALNPTNGAQSTWDLAIISLSVSPSKVSLGEIAIIDIKVENQGFPTVANYSVFANYSKPLSPALYLLQKGLLWLTQPGMIRTGRIEWNTTDFPIGEYTIRAEVIPLPNETDIGDNIRIFEPVILTPAAKFTYEVIGMIDKVIAVMFNASASTSGVDTYWWFFGDDSRDLVHTPIVTHNYAKPGNYTVKLIVFVPYFEYGGSTVITINVRLSSDLNGDGVVNIIDVAIVAKAFGSKPGDPRWNPIADLDNNGIINIVDVAKVAREFGKKL